MTLLEHALTGSELVVDEASASLALGLPWYRSMPFGSVVDLTVTLAGASFGMDRLGIRLQDELIPAERLRFQPGYWFLQDRLTIEVTNAPIVGGGEVADVEILVSLVLPNMVRIDGGPIVVVQQVAGRCPVVRRDVTNTA